jgi:hypothetical protein
MGLLSVISPAGDDELLPGHVVPAGRAVPVPPATALGGHLEVARPVWVLVALAEGLQCPPQTSHRIGPSSYVDSIMRIRRGGWFSRRKRGARR